MIDYKKFGDLVESYKTAYEELDAAHDEILSECEHYEWTIEEIKTHLEEIPVDDKSADAIARIQKLLDEALSKPPEPKLKGE